MELVGGLTYLSPTVLVSYCTLCEGLLDQEDQLPNMALGELNVFFLKHDVIQHCYAIKPEEYYLPQRHVEVVQGLQQQGVAWEIFREMMFAWLKSFSRW